MAERMEMVEFSPCSLYATVLQTWVQRKKEIETFRQSTQAAEMKGQAPVIKSPWAAIDFFLASVTPTVRHDGHGFSIECMNIDKTM